MSTDTPQIQTLAGFSPPSTLGSCRAVDYWALPEGEPAELIMGRLVVSPAPSLLHQTISALLTELLLGVARIEGGRMFAAPTDVVLADHSIVQPDLLYIAKARRPIIQQQIMGPPDLVIEILSEQNARRDRVDKLNLYAEYDVPEYWICDPNERQFDFLINRERKFEIQPQQNDRYTSPRLPALTIQLDRFWAEVDRQISGKLGPEWF